MNASYTNHETLKITLLPRGWLESDRRTQGLIAIPEAMCSHMGIDGDPVVRWQMFKKWRERR